MEKNLRDLLAEYAGLLNRYGVDSPEASRLIEAHKLNSEFVELADLSRKLKKALTAPAGDCVRSRGRSCEN
jgi:hypothetical protein